MLPRVQRLRDVSRGRGCEPPVELARGLADTLRVVRDDRRREAGEVVRQELLRRGAAEAVGGTVGDLALVDEGGVVLVTLRDQLHDEMEIAGREGVRRPVVGAPLVRGAFQIKPAASGQTTVEVSYSI